MFDDAEDLTPIARCAQNSANRTMFRETYMEPLNSLLEANSRKVVDYLRDAAVLARASPALPTRQVSLDATPLARR